MNGTDLSLVEKVRKHRAASVRYTKNALAYFGAQELEKASEFMLVDLIPPEVDEE